MALSGDLYISDVPSRCWCSWMYHGGWFTAPRHQRSKCVRNRISFHYWRDSCRWTWAWWIWRNSWGGCHQFTVQQAWIISFLCFTFIHVVETRSRYFVLGALESDFRQILLWKCHTRIKPLETWRYHCTTVNLIDRSWMYLCYGVESLRNNGYRKQ